MKADASYSASRAEMNLGKKTFQDWQKWLERYLLDWEVWQAISYAISIKRLDPSSSWLGAYSFTHPDIEPIDSYKEALANTEALSNGTKTLQDILGPRWSEQVAQRGKELELIQQLWPFVPERAKPDPNMLAQQ